jgi:predicted GNAT family acetyltransferase
MSDVTNNTAQSRYELLTEGHLSIADYHRQENKLIITHVEVPEALRGQGVAAKLMAGVVADAKAKNLAIVPVCPYAVSYLKKHPQ